MSRLVDDQQAELISPSQKKRTHRDDFIIKRAPVKGQTMENMMEIMLVSCIDVRKVPVLIQHVENKEMM